MTSSHPGSLRRWVISHNNGILDLPIVLRDNSQDVSYYCPSLSSFFVLRDNSQDVSYYCPSLSSFFEVAVFENVSHKNSIVLLVCTILATSLAHPKFSLFRDPGDKQPPRPEGQHLIEDAPVVTVQDKPQWGSPTLRQASTA